MGVPLEIRQVPRPKNTIVDDNKRPGPFQYAVRERSGVSYVSGGNPKPRNGKVIGHIFNGKFVPVETQKQTKESKPSMFSYGSSELARSLSCFSVVAMWTYFSLIIFAKTEKPIRDFNRFSREYNGLCGTAIDWLCSTMWAGYIVTYLAPLASITLVM